MLSCDHFLLYLTRDTWRSQEADSLARETAYALQSGMPVLLVHELDSARGGAPFELFFETTPPHLIRMKLFGRSLAFELHRGAHRDVSLRLLAKEIIDWKSSRLGPNAHTSKRHHGSAIWRFVSGSSQQGSEVSLASLGRLN